MLLLPRYRFKKLNRHATAAISNSSGKNMMYFKKFEKLALLEKADLYYNQD